MRKKSNPAIESQKKVMLQEIRVLKKKLKDESEKILSLDDLIGQPVDREPGLWECTYAELEDELWQRFSVLEAKTEDMLGEGIPDVRKPWKWFADLYEKSVKLFLGPYRKHIVLMRKLLDKQMLINKEFVSIHLATILSLVNLKDRLTALEIQAKKILEEQDDLSEEFEYFEKTRKDK